MNKYHRNTSKRLGFIILSCFALSLAPGGIRMAHAVLGQPCSVENLDPVCDTCNGELCHNFGDSQNPDLKCGVAEINGFVGDTPTFFYTLTPSYQSPQCPNGQLLNIANNATETFPEFPGCWNECTTAVIEPTRAGYYTFLGPVCHQSTTYCQDISGGAESNSCRVGQCSETPTFDSNNPSGCTYDLQSEEENFTCARCDNAAELEITSCGNGICEVDQGEDCQSCSVDCLIPGFEDSCPLTSGTVISDACTSDIGKKISFSGPLYNRNHSKICEDGDLCTDNQCSSDGLSCDSTPKACSGDTGDFCCPANCQPPADGSSCGTATDCDIDCFAPKTCQNPASDPANFASNLCVTGGGMGSGDSSCSSCSLNKSGASNPGTSAAFGGLALVLLGFFLKQRAGN